MKPTRITPDVRRKMKQIQIYTRRLLTNSLVGDSRSAIRGSGFEFDQIREYRQGDDIRFIDWNASSRMNSLLVKEYIEERSRTILLCVDISSSVLFGSTDATKRDVMAEVASVLALVANCGKDRTGLLLFSDEVELYIPPGRGHQHVNRIIEFLFCHRSKHKTTSLQSILKRLIQERQRNAIVFLISDFIDEDDTFKRYLPIASRMYDLIALRCLDRNEKALPAVGLLTIEDRETGELTTIDTRAGHNERLHSFFATRLAEQDKLFKRYGIELLDISIHSSFVADLIKFFRRRMQY